MIVPCASLRLLPPVTGAGRPLVFQMPARKLSLPLGRNLKKHTGRSGLHILR